MTQLQVKETRCTLCSLACSLGFTATSGGRVLPDYPRQSPDLRGGICGRGHLNYELLSHPLRLEQPLIRKNGKPVPTPLPRLAQDLRDALVKGPTLVVVDGNLPAQDIVAAGTFARILEGDSAWTVCMDPADEALLTGVAASGTKLLTPEDLADCDAALCVGDAFGTHPVISRPVHTVRRQDPRRMFVVIDSVRSRTSKLATTFLEVKAGGESSALRFLAGEGSVEQAAAESGLDVATLETVAGGLKKAERLGVLLAAEFGKAVDWDAAAALAGQIAKNRGGGLTPLPTGGNAWGAYGVARALGAMKLGRAVEELLAGRFKTVVTLGVDLAAEIPVTGLDAAMRKVPTLVVATTLTPLNQTVGTHFLPLATNVEVDGTVVNGFGEVVELKSVLKPAGGALSARELLAALMPEAGETITRRALEPAWLKPATDTTAQECLRRRPTTLNLKEGRLIGVSESGCVHHGAGLTSRRMSWPAVFEAKPTVRMAREDADVRGLLSGNMVTVKSDHGSARMVVVVEKGQRPGQVGLWSHSTEVRSLFDWKTTDGRLAAGPAAVSITKA